MSADAATGLSTRTGNRALAEMMRGYGVSHAFFVPTFLLPALAEMEDLGVRTISTHGEKSAAYMADGYARVSRRPGVCLAQTVGGANLAAGLKDARMAGSPVIALTGGPYPESRYRHVYQEICDAAMFEPVTKWQASVEVLERLPELLRQAFRVATSGTPGPVYLEVRSHLGQLLEGEAVLDTLVEPRFGEVPAFRPEPDPASLAEALKALHGASRPVIVAGGGAVWSGAEPELVALAEQLQIPIATSLSAKAVIAESHPLNVGVAGFYSRRCANQVVAEADLVFFVGSHTGSMVTNNWSIPSPGTPVVQLDIDPAELGRHYPGQLSLHGDARATLKRMLEHARARANPSWTSRVQELVARWREEVRDQVTSDATPIRPERLCADLAEALPDDAALLVDTLQASIWAGSMTALRGPSQRFARCAGSLGWGLPAGLGAKCALGERPVMALVGDGGLYYHLAELETAARYGINAVIVVNNNGAYAGEKPFWDAAYGVEQSPAGYASWTFGDIDFAKIAGELGCVGVRVERAADIAPAVTRGLAAGRPVLIDVVTDPAAIHPRGWAP
ncbi:MAG: thiamine pyrophosphate-binding protein [Candidatus Dormibacteraceae bacterium]